ncbi:MAG TPA: DUF2911 domain-containing protein [Bryobacteraceae bacterium]|nr:DUF2911 domain-containing protein [Bryobacteraceae bacterium]
MLKRKQTARIVVALAVLVGWAGAQEKRASPHATAAVTLKGQQISIAYGRPAMRGRKIVGGVVPYGQVWRTGADEATSLVTPVDLMIGGSPVPAGKYTLYSLPAEGSWKLIINKQTGQWGTNYDEAQDLARIEMRATKTAAPVERFTVSWTKTGADQAELALEWENTRLTVPVAVK